MRGGVVVVQEHAGGVQAGHDGHRDVEQEHVGAEGSAQVDRRAAVGRLADHVDPGFGLGHQAQAGADHRLVVGDEHPDRHRGESRGSVQNRTKPDPPPPGGGRFIVTGEGLAVIPRRVPMSSRRVLDRPPRRGRSLKAFTMPDFYVPYPARLNPHLERSRAHTMAWAKEMGMLDAPKPGGGVVWTAEELDRMDYALMCALHPPRLRRPGPRPGHRLVRVGVLLRRPLPGAVQALARLRRRAALPRPAGALHDRHPAGAGEPGRGRA